MKHVIIGTAGHVDHGKTSLIQALTGTNPDRLKEEQERGMTIDIGFAALRLPDGTVAGIVDVPGHERFLKNMLAGAIGVDVVLLVIAADEGIMPQTTEHLNVLRLLDARNGVVALTKIDLVEKEWTDVVEEDIRAQFKDTFLADAPIIRVSSSTGKGVEAVRKALQAAVSRANARDARLPFRLPVDRVFTRPGFGTVVTGTLVSGIVRAGDSVEIMPQQSAARIRGLQVHGQKVSEASAGSRVAINLAGVEHDAVERGAQITPPGALEPASAFDATLQLLADAPRALKDRARVRAHLGTAEILGRVRILEQGNALEPGEKTYIQFSAEEPFAAARGDRFIIRSYSPARVIGGGIVLDARPAKHRKGDTATLSALVARERGTPQDLIETLLLRSPSGLLLGEIASGSGLSADTAQAAVEAMQASGAAIAIAQDRIIHKNSWQTLTDRAIKTLGDYHKQYPLRAGMPKEEWRGQLANGIDNKALASLMETWRKENKIRVEGAAVRLTDFEIALNEKQQRLMSRIEEVYKICGIAIPSISEVAREVNAPSEAVDALVKIGADQQRFARVEDGLYYHQETVEALKCLISEHIKQHGGISVGEFRDLTRTNRKYALMALEYFDRRHFTRRQEETRTLYSP